MKDFFRLILLYVVVFMIYAGTFIGLVRTEIAMDLPLFFRGCLFLVITAVGLLIILAGFKKLRGKAVGNVTGFTMEYMISAIILSASVNFGFFVVVPVTIDRSVTTFLLASMESTDREKVAFTKDKLQEIMERNYLRKYDAVGRRLEEQLVSGNVKKVDGDRYLLTEQGKAFLKFARDVAAIYGISPRYISSGEIENKH